MASTDCTRRELRNRARLALWLAIPFVGLMLLVPPRGDFPLNDDWVYAKMVQALTERGHFGLSPLSNAYSLTQTLYAAPLVKLFGFSFTLLRLTTIVMGWVTVCFVAFTARELGLPNRSAILAALTVFVNPLFINLSYTFMTDVPFCAFALISTYYFVKALRAPTTANLLLGTLFSIVAFYNRQFGVLIPIAFAIAALTQCRQFTAGPSVRGAALVAAPWIFAIAILWMLPGPRVQLEVVTPFPGIGQRAIETAFFVLPMSVFFAGLFLLPITVCVAVDALCRPSKDIGWRVMVLPIVALVSLFTSGLAIHYLQYGAPHILRYPAEHGIGPKLFASLYSPGNSIPEDVRAPSGWEAIIAYVASCVSMGIAVTVLAGIIFVRRQRPLAVRTSADRFLVLLILAFALAPAAAMSGPYYDRYLLAALPAAALLLARGVTFVPRKPAVFAAAFVGTGLLAYSTIGVQDYMAWNAARWQAIDLLRTKYGAHDNGIDGGYEFNGMYTSEEYLRRLQDEPDTFVQRRWWVIGERFRVLPVDSTPNGEPYEVIDKVPYFSWLGFQTRYMYVLQATTRP